MTKSLKFVDVYLAPDLVLTLKICEFFLTALLFRLLISYGKIIFAKTWCHRNLRLLLILQPASHWIAIFVNLVRHLLEFTNFLRKDTVALMDFLNMLGDILLVIATGAMLPIAIERLVAAIFAKNYEHINHKVPYLAIFLYIFIIFIAVYLEILLYSDTIDVYDAYAFIGLIFSIATIIFAILPLASRRHFAIISKRRNTTVSERYQTAENMRAAHLLKYVSAYKCLTNFLSLAFYMVAFQIDPYFVPLSTEIYYYWNILQLICQMLLTTLAHDVLRDQVIRRFRRNNSKIYDERDKEIRSVTGQRLIFSQNEEGKKYFEMYMDAWRVGMGEGISATNDHSKRQISTIC